METMDLDGMVTEMDKAGVDDAVLMRYMWALMLYSMFDDTACQHGCTIVQNLTGVGFMGMRKLQNVFGKVEDELNKMFYGTTLYAIPPAI